MKEPKLLVVMPVYNSEETLATAIESVLNQKHSNLSLTIIDDASEDDSWNIAKSYMFDDRVKVYKNKENMGAYYCRNYGLYINRNEKWDFFTVHDSDDVSYKQRYKTMINRFRDHVSAVQDMMVRKDLKTGKEISETITMSHAVYRRFIFDSIGYFDDVRIAGDSEYWQRARTFAYSQKMKPLSHKDVLHEAFIHKNNLTVQYPLHSKKRKKYIQAADVRLSEMSANNNFYMDFGYKKSKITSKSKGLTSVQQKYKNSEVAIVILSWKRTHRLHKSLEELDEQTFKNFKLIISNSNEDEFKTVESIVRRFKGSLDVSVRRDNNDFYSFRRMFIGKELAEQGYKVIMFLDDDISIPEDYVRRALSQHEPKTFKSHYAWTFYKKPNNYYKQRTRRYDNRDKIHYCGTGVSILDASFFLEDGLVDDAPKEAYKIEDLWMSYYADQVLGWKLKYLNMHDVEIAGADSHALHKEILGSKYNKSHFLVDLQEKFNWDLS